MANRREALFAFGLLALSSSARTQERPAANDDEVRKLWAAFDFVRTRNAKDYAIATPSGIDEAKYLKIGGIDQWVTIRGEVEPIQSCSCCTAGQVTLRIPGDMPVSEPG